MSCDEIEPQNWALSMRTIYVLGNEIIQLPPSIIAENLVQTAIDNIDHDEGRTSHTDGSHDITMV